MLGTLTDRRGQGHKPSCQCKAQQLAICILLPYPLYWCSHASGRWVHKCFTRGKRRMEPCPFSPITWLWLVTSILMTSLPRNIPGHPHTLDRVTRWEQRNELLKNTSCLPQRLTIPKPTAVGGGWAVLDPIKPCFNYFPPLEILMSSQQILQMYYWCHEEDLLQMV